MRIKKKEASIIEKAIKAWVDKGLLNNEQALNLKNSYEVTGVDWQAIAFYSFVFAITSFVVAIITLFTDNWLLAMINKIAEAKNVVKFLFFTSLSLLFFYLGTKRRRLYPEKIYSNEMFFLLGILASATAIVYLSLTFNYSFGHYSFLIIGAALLYAYLGYWFPSQVTWLFALVALGVWFGFQTALFAEWKPYFFGMSYQVRFTLFGMAMSIASLGLLKIHAVQAFFKVSFGIGLLYFFSALWAVSVFGNLPDLEIWMHTKQSEMFLYGFTSTALSGFAIYLGVHYKTHLLRDIGAVFLVINLYTRFFEYGWAYLHKAVFFSILAASFWIMGKQAEKFMSRK